MSPHEPAVPPDIEQKSFMLLLLVLTIGFAVVVQPYFGAVLWAAILALLFTPLYRWLLGKTRQRRIWAALGTLAVVLLMVILPLALVAVSLTQEVAALFAKVKSGEVDFGRYFQQIMSALPAWANGLLERFEIGNTQALQEKLRAGLMQRGQALAGSAVDVGQNALDIVVSFFIAMYVFFFLLLDGPKVVRGVERAVPLQPKFTHRLMTQLAAVVKATVKGNVLVAIAQGALGGLAFWVLGVHAPMLWAVVMAFLSLLPAIGAALIWGPVAIYLLATGQVWQGVALIAFGTLVIGLVDNILRPILVGKDIELPDYVVLVSTIGGLAVFGINGFVIGPVIVAMFLVAWNLFAAHRPEREPRP